MSRPKGTKNTMRSVEEKIKILQEYYDTGMNAPLIYRKYNISPSTFYKWKYYFEVEGIEALDSKTGKSTSKFKGKKILKSSREEFLEKRICELEIENYKLKQQLSKKALKA